MKGWLQYDSVLRKLSNIEDCGEYLKATCPAHDDRQASLSLAIGRTGHLVVKCHAGCSFREVLDAGGIEMKETFADSPSKSPKKRSGGIDTVYTYRDESGKTVYEVVKFQPKSFRPRRPPRETDDPSSIKNGWVWNLRGTTRILYRLDELRRALDEKPDRIVVVVEGEKDVDRMFKNGFVATTSVGGAGKWQDSFSEVLRNCHVVILPDADDANENGKSPGMEHALDVQKKLNGIAKTADIVELEGLPSGGDVSDWFERGGTAEMLKDIVLRNRSSGQVVADSSAGQGGSSESEQGSSDSVFQQATVCLTVREIVTAGEFGVIRRANQLMQNKNNDRKTTGWEFCIENVAGELAVAKFFGWYWQGGIRIGERQVVVRTRKDRSQNLVVKQNDDPAALYVFVTGSCPEFVIWGAISGEQAMGLPITDLGHVVDKERLIDPRSMKDGY